MLKLVNATIEVPGRTLLAGAELEVERGEHVVLVGPNGAGKTTLIETLAGQREPAAGSVRTGHNVKLGYLSQHADTAAGEGTVLDAAQRETGLSGQKARDLLGGFLFSGADVEKQLDDISGGEQRRLSLAILVASGANVLILDEPTNHLDIESREALEDALLAFEGAVVLVSHDRALLEAVGSRTIVCEDGELRSHPSGWADVPAPARRSARRAAAAAAAAKRAGQGRQATAPPKPAAEGGAQGGPPGASGSSAPKRSCARSRRSWPTPPPGRPRPGRAGRASATRRRSARSRSSTSSGRRPKRTTVSAAGDRSLTTRCPWPGARVMLRTLTFSGFGSGALQLGALDELAQDRSASRIRRRRRRCSGARRRRRGSRRSCRPCRRGSARAGTRSGSGKRSSR